MLAKKGLRLDAVIELKVDPDILVRRIENRVEQMKLRGEPLRPDDNPEVLKQRLAAYEAQTAPLVTYYRGKGALRAVDGMASISDVAAAIGRALADAAFRPVPTARKAAPAPRKAAVRRQNRARARPRAGRAGPKAANRPRPPRRRSRARAGQRRPAKAAKPAARRAAETPQKSRKSARGAEVDEVRMNPLITGVFSRTQFERCRPRSGWGGRRVIAWKTLPGLPAFGTGRNGKALNGRPEQE